MLLIDGNDDHDNGGKHWEKKNIYILSPHDLVLTNMFYILLSPFKVKELPIWEVRA